MLSEEAKKQYRITHVISFGLLSGVAFFAVVAGFLVQQGAAPAGSLDTVPLPVIAAVGVVALLAAPRIGGMIRGRPVADEEDALASFTLSVVVAQAIREGVGFAGIALAMLAGDLNWMIVFTVISVGAIFLGRPKERELEEMVRPFRSID